MRPSEDQMNQLLSEYLDDALDADESQSLQQWLLEDPTLAKRLAVMSDLKVALQELGNQSTGASLPPGFSELVLTAAVARAREEGVSETHPLMKLSERPIVASVMMPSRVSSHRLIAAVLALAACIGLLIVVIDRDDDKVGVADSLITDSGRDEVPGKPSPREDIADTSAPSIVKPLSSEQQVVMESNESVPSSSESLAATEIASSVTTSSDSIAKGLIEEMSESAVVSDLARGDLDTSQSVVRERQKEVTSVMLGAVLVLELRRTEVGQQEQCVREALAEVGIRQSNRVAVEPEILEAIVSSSGNPADISPENSGLAVRQADSKKTKASVLYLQLTAKQFDRFYQLVWSDQRGVDSLAMSLAMDAPVIGLVDSLRRDPTAVQHDATAFEVGQSENQSLVEHLSDLPFTVLNRGQSDVPMVGSGEDLQTQVLLLVR